jgi:microsomal epoxide hydrolase
VNFCSIGRPASAADDSTLPEIEQDALKRWEAWKLTGTAYALEQATKPSTIGFVLSSNPLAVLAWYVHSPICLADDSGWHGKADSSTARQDWREVLGLG